MTIDRGELPEDIDDTSFANDASHSDAIDPPAKKRTSALSSITSIAVAAAGFLASPALAAETPPIEKVENFEQPVPLSREKLMGMSAPEHWEDVSFKAAGRDVTSYLAKADNEVMQLDFCAGLHSICAAYTDSIAILNSYGISVRIMQLVDEPDPDEFMRINLAATKKFYASADERLKNPDLPRVAGGHSTGGLCLDIHSANPFTLSQMDRNYQAMVKVGAFYDVSYASSRHYPRLHASFQKHAAKNPDVLAGSDGWGKVVSWGHRQLGEPQIFSSIREPKYGEITSLIRHADILFAKRAKSAMVPTMGNYYIIPKYDTAACPKTSEDMANLSGGRIIRVPHYHNPLLEAEINARRLAGLLLYAAAQPRIHQKATINRETLKLTHHDEREERSAIRNAIKFGRAAASEEHPPNPEIWRKPTSCPMPKRTMPTIANG
jgi:hypothetical protein